MVFNIANFPVLISHVTVSVFFYDLRVTESCFIPRKGLISQLISAVFRKTWFHTIMPTIKTFLLQIQLPLYLAALLNLGIAFHC